MPRDSHAWYHQSKAIEISEENLEDLLAYDDIFVDYFNAFLSLPTFPQPLFYNRLTGLFEEVPSRHGGSVHEGSGPFSPPPYGATDEERERMLQWAKEARLPRFLKTTLFRELKLNKLLLRPLDDRYSASRRGSHYTLRGYSRQTETYASSLSNSVGNSANDATDLDDDDASVWGVDQRALLFRYQRPGSRAISLPPRLNLPTSAPVSTPGLLNVGADPWRQGSGGATGGRQRQQGQPSGPMPSALRITSGAPVSSGPARDVTFDDKTETFGSEEQEAEVRITTADQKSGKSSGSRRRSSQRVSVTTDKDSKGDAPTVVESADGQERLRSATYSDFDAVFGEDEPEVTEGEAYVAFADDVVSDTQTETDVKHLEGKHKMTVQQMKEKILGQFGGQQKFYTFLRGTTGEHLYNFWLDCEDFKDTMEDYDEIETSAHRNRLFRDIQDKYKLKLTEDAKKQILQGSSNTMMSHTIFLRTQYDVLRRLRAYWLPRFLIHKERLDELSRSGHPQPQEEYSTQLKSVANNEDASDVTPRSGLSFFFPSISLVNSMPVMPEALHQICTTLSWDIVCKGGRKLDDRIKSAKMKVVAKPPQQSVREKLILALSADKAAGGPFKYHLIRSGDEKMLSTMLFWEDVTEYGRAEDRSADRLLRMSNAWSIFNKYIALGSKHSIGADPRQRDELHSLLLNARDFVAATVFNPAKTQAVDLLEKAWVRFLKEDAKRYYDCHVRNSESPASTAEDFELLFDDNENLIVRRPRPWTRRYPPSTCSERGERLRTALSLAESIDEARRIEQRRRAKERRRVTERERRKAIRNARQRQRDAKRKVSFKPNQTQGETEGVETEQKEEEEEAPQEEEVQEEEKQQDFIGSVTNKGVVSLFKKYITENEGRELLNIVNLYLDIEAYHTISSEKNGKAKRDTHANFINKTYLEQGARKRVLMNERVYEKLKKEKDRPKTGTLKDVQAHLLPTLEDTFKKFWESQAEELGIDSKSMANMSKAELAMRADNDPSLLTGWRKKGKGQGKMGSARTVSRSETVNSDDSCSIKVNTKGKKPDGRAQPTREDRMEFLVALNNAAAGKFPMQMLYFYKYLVKHGQEDGFPLIDKDLFFYCEVQKFKEGSHQHADEELIKRKVQSIVDCYLESCTPPALQIDIPSELQLKTSRAAQRYLSGKDINPALFDEAQYMTFKELLPYWSGFIRQWKQPDDVKKRPVTKQERERKKRQEDFDNWKPPSAKTFSLPSVPKGTAVGALTFSLTDGVKWKEGGGIDDAFGVTPDARKLGFDARRNSLLSNVDSVMESEQSSIYA